MSLSAKEKSDLSYAKLLLENPGLAARIVDYVGMPIEKGIEYLPANWKGTITSLTTTALEKAVDAALFTLADGSRERSRDRLHKLAVAATGAAGGAFGWAGLSVELPLSTVVILRSIADIARSEGESMWAPETRLACIEVFALGGRTKSDDANDSAYFIVRSAIAEQMREAAMYLAKQGSSRGAAPALVRMITAVATRFNIQVQEKVIAQAVPVVGAVGGAGVVSGGVGGSVLSRRACRSVGDLHP